MCVLYPKNKAAILTTSAAIVPIIVAGGRVMLETGPVIIPEPIVKVRREPPKRALRCQDCREEGFRLDRLNEFKESNLGL